MIRVISINQFNLCIIAAAVGLGLLVVGCGGGDSGASAGTESEVATQVSSLSKAQFIEKADAICEKKTNEFHNEIETLQSQLTQGSAASELTKSAKLVTVVFVPTFEKEIGQIEALGAPEGDEEDIAAILAAMQRTLDEGKDEPLTVLRREHTFGKGFQLARAYGFTACGGA